MDYASTHPNATIGYHASNMILMAYTDADYLVFHASRNRITRNYYFTKHMLDYSKIIPTQNVPILTEFKSFKTAVSPSDKAEIGGTFENAQNVIPL